MKTKINFSSIMLILAIVVMPIFSQATTTSFKTSILKTIKHPSSNNQEGIVWLNISVDTNGKCRVNYSNHDCCQELSNSLIKQIDGKTLKDFNSSMIGEHNIKFIFRIGKTF